nr:ribonuclease H-like domain-containing protein [Tanacetum cinerariifolium]
MSTSDAEYVSLSACCAQVIWMRTQLLDYGYKYNRILMYCDFKSTIANSCNQLQHSKTKHIDIQYHFIKEHVEKGTVELYFFDTEYQLADLFTKALPKERFEYLVHRIELLWEGIYYSLLHSTSLIPYPRFTKIIIGHYMTNFPEISRRVRDKYHNLKDDDLMKNIFNSGKYKRKVGMKIQDWMIIEARKQTEHYRMIPSASRSPNPKVDVADSSAPTRSTVIHLCIPQRRSTCLTPPALVPTVDKADELILQDTLQVSLAEHKSRQEQEARENAALVDEHLATVEIEKMVEGQEIVVDDSSITRNDEHNIPGTRLEPRSDKESPEVEVTNVLIPVNVYDKEEEADEITDEVYDLKQKEKGNNVEESRIKPFPTPIRSPRIHTDLESSDNEKLQELTGRYGYLFEHLKARFMPRKSFATLANHLHDAMAESLPDSFSITHINKYV